MPSPPGTGDMTSARVDAPAAPSANCPIPTLIALGVRRAIRVGTCGALSEGLALGDLVIARESICADGTSRALGAGERAAADAALTDALAGHAPSAVLGTIVSVDLFYERGERRLHPGAIAVEMEAAALFATGAATGVPVACVLAVSDTFDASGARERVDDAALLAAAERMGRAAIAAVSA